MIPFTYSKFERRIEMGIKNENEAKVLDVDFKCLEIENKTLMNFKLKESTILKLRKIAKENKTSMTRVVEHLIDKVQ